MLVLTRKLQEQIKVGENITITILRVSGKSVRVGIEAPREVRVVRAELPERSTKATTSRTSSQRSAVRRAPLADRLAARGTMLPGHDSPADVSPPARADRPRASAASQPAGHLRGTTPAASLSTLNPTSERLGSAFLRVIDSIR